MHQQVIKDFPQTNMASYKYNKYTESKKNKLKQNHGNEMAITNQALIPNALHKQGTRNTNSRIHNAVQKKRAPI